MEKSEVMRRVLAMRAKLTIDQIATLVGVSTRTVARWERGDTVPDNRAVCAALERASAPFVGGAA
jgi:DNA-binding transcriptional regulator YiaG